MAPLQHRWARIGFLIFVLAGCGDDDDGPADAPDAAVDAPVDAASDSADASDTNTVDAADASALNPIAMTNAGPVEGNALDGVSEFLGIPYAAAPVGERRWAAPVPPAPWTEPRGARLAPPRCEQFAGGGLSFPGTEDCLVVNVHTPFPRREDLPVMVWLHGGAFVLGEGVQSDQKTRGDLLAREEGVVVVSVNYRLGVMGFFGHPAITAGDGPAANFGLLDQIAALEWVRDNIASFGGDPNNVTIFGESAGGFSVCALATSPAADGLFRRMISQSGFCSLTLGTLEDAEAFGESMAESVGCAERDDVLACLRETPPEAFRAALPALQSLSTLTQLLREDAEVFGAWPVVDGEVLPEQVHARLPSLTIDSAIVGWTADEGALFVFLEELGGGAPSYDRDMRALAEASGAPLSALMERYPLSDFRDEGHAVGAAVGEAALVCPSRWAAESLDIPTYAYQFNFPDAAFQISGDRALGAFHSAEIQYIFGRNARIGGRALRGEHETLHDEMRSRWAAFARDGAVPEWPRMDRGEDVLSLDRVVAPDPEAKAEACAFWSAFRRR